MTGARPGIAIFIASLVFCALMPTIVTQGFAAALLFLAVIVLLWRTG